jgi:hypothetical protein
MVFSAFSSVFRTLFLAFLLGSCLGLIMVEYRLNPQKIQSKAHIIRCSFSAIPDAFGAISPKFTHFRMVVQKAEQYFVELVAPQEVRLARNVTENRLKNKASKRNVEVSNQRLVNDDKKYRLESRDGELDFENYIKIDNSNLSPEQTAQMIKEKFDL